MGTCLALARHTLTLSATDAWPGCWPPGLQCGGPQGRAGHHAVGCPARWLGPSILEPFPQLAQLGLSAGLGPALGRGTPRLIPSRPGRGQAAAVQGLGGLHAAAVGGLAEPLCCGDKRAQSRGVRCVLRLMCLQQPLIPLLLLCCRTKSKQELCYEPDCFLQPQGRPR